MDIMKSRMAIHPKRSSMDVRHPRNPAILGPKEKRSLLAQQKLSVDMAVSQPVSPEIMEPPKDTDIIQLDNPPSASTEKPSSPEETQLPETKVQPKKKQSTKE